MTEREKLLRQLAAQDFAAFELHLFLNSHPNDTATAAKLADFRTKADALRAEYEEKFGPLQSSDENGNRWAWISNPWPWDVGEEE